MKLLKFVIYCTLLACGVANATFAPTSGTWTSSWDGGSYSGASRDAVCAAVLVGMKQLYVRDSGWVEQNKTSTAQCSWRNDHPEFGPGGVTRYANIESPAAGCPANSSTVTGGCQCNTTFSEQGGQCVNADAACQSSLGEVARLNYTLGWTRTADDNDTGWVGGSMDVPNNGQTVCHKGCNVGINPAPSMVWRSQTPGPNGLYRTSADYEGIQLGYSCTPSNSARNAPSAPVPECPGFVGEVNGKLGCYGTAARPVTSTSAVPPKPPAAGNPAAGPVPSTGEGSGSSGEGRTPSAGNGTNAGGPAAAASASRGGTGGGSSSGTGTIKAPASGEQQAQCGAPGQPKCGVDETGTPSEKSFSDADTKIQDYKDQVGNARTNAAGAGDKGMFENFRQLWAAPPIAACSPIALPERIGRSIDPCAVVDGVRMIMAYIWAAAALFLCFRWIKEVM